MAESKQQTGKPGQTNALVCAAIHYLDSDSNYRECLQPKARSKVTQKNDRLKKSKPQTDDFVLLDDIPAYQLNWLWTFALIGIFLLMVLLGLLQS
jgi:hypothetical protein